ncbi:hypothetical protein B0H19DRAFT_1250667 [Mycena capillaripes]|nr:hypothetical protein B0H19DRAFT_1250667 [Mycena capillaripes]
MKFTLLSAAVLACTTTLISAWQCTPGRLYCGSRFIDKGCDYAWYWGAAEQGAADFGIPQLSVPRTLFECSTAGYISPVKACRSGTSCIAAGRGNDDYCL